jgi:predicted alpha/beta-hydrolase family hydrolase
VTTWLQDTRINGAAGSAQFIFAHGAGAPMDSPFMEVIAGAIASKGIDVLRFEFPYMYERRLSGKKRPPNTQKALLEAWHEILKTYRSDKPCFIGGKSMGGRMASLMADEAQVDGLICMGYPFHPPGKPDKLRTDHLADLKTPTLILQGSRDTMGSAEEVPGYDLGQSIEISWLADGDHSFKPRKASGYSEAQHWQTAADKAVRFIQSRI